MEARPRAVLAIDTAGPEIGVAGVGEGIAPIEWRERVGRGADAVLLPALERILGQLDALGTALSGVAITVGPGAFTGLRVGLAAALGVAVARRVPVFAEGSLEARARMVPTRPLLVLLDARKQRFYGRWFDEAGASRPAADRPLDAWLADHPPGLALGEGALVARERLDAAGWTVLDNAGRVPVVVLGEAALQGRIPGVDAAQVTLQYVRPPDARKPVHLLRPPRSASGTRR